MPVPSPLVLAACPPGLRGLPLTEAAAGKASLAGEVEDRSQLAPAGRQSVLWELARGFYSPWAETVLRDSVTHSDQHHLQGVLKLTKGSRWVPPGQQCRGGGGKVGGSGVQVWSCFCYNLKSAGLTLRKKREASGVSSQKTGSLPGNYVFGKDQGDLNWIPGSPNS